MEYLMEFLIDPPDYKSFYDSEYDVIVALTTTTARIYVYLYCSHDVDVSGAPVIPATSPVASTLSWPRAPSATFCTA